MNFVDNLVEAIKAKGTPICVGLDPRIAQIPQFLKDKAMAENPKDLWKASAEAFLAFNKGIIDAVADLVPVVKPQWAFYEEYGAEGVRVFAETIEYAKSKGLLVIADVKRNDIGSTAQASARAFLGASKLIDGSSKVLFDADCVTVTAYPGWDGVKPFVEQCSKNGKGIFVWVKSSNPSGGDLQDLVMKDEKTVYEIMGQYVDSWGADAIGDSGFSSVGAVVGATYPDQARKLRELMPNTFFLVPGFGAQGGSAEDVKPCFNNDGLGAIINSSRGIVFAYEKSDEHSEKEYAEAARAAVLKMKEQLEEILT